MQCITGHVHSPEFETSGTTASLQQEISTLDNEEWPEGDPIPLNARRLTLSMLCQIGEALGVPSSSSATNAELKLMMEGRLTEMGYDLANVQVIVSDNTNEPMYLVNDEGIIKRVESVAIWHAKPNKIIWEVVVSFS